MYQMLTILAMACAGSEQSIVLDLAMPVSPVRVKAEQISVTVRNVPPNWSLQTKVVIAPAPVVSLVQLQKFSESTTANSVNSQATLDTGTSRKGQSSRCTVKFDSTSFVGALKSALEVIEKCKDPDTTYKAAKSFLEQYDAIYIKMDSLRGEVQRATSPSEVDKMRKEIHATRTKDSRWSGILKSVVDTFAIHADSATTRRFECSLDWNDSAIVTASNQAADQTKAKRIDIAIVRWKNPKTLKGVSIGVSYFRHDVNNYTVSHTYDTTGKMLTSRIENNPEENGSLQPSLMVALPLCAWQVGKQDWEAGLAFGYTPKIDLSNVRIFDASLSAGVFVGSHPFGINLSFGATPLAHLKGGYKTGQVYDGDLDAANVTQNTFAFMYGGGIFWSFN